MARKTIGLCYFFDNNSNSGIVNYVFNIVASLMCLEDKLKPNLKIFYSEMAPIDFLKTIGYPYIKYVSFRSAPSNLVFRKVNSLVKICFKVDLFKYLMYYSKVDSLYPYFDFLDYGFRGAKNKIHWLVDFNNRSFPQHYDDGGLIMNKYQEKVTALSARVVLSSEAMFSELKRYHPNFKCEIKILKFASTLPPLNESATSLLLKQLGIQGPYFMSPNQFWEHKNHSIILDAISIIKNQYPELSFKVLFTGSLEVNRGKGLYVNKLKAKINDDRLSDYLLLLGVLNRNDQLVLMKNALCLIQPSLYEGWSTLVEEAKALSKFIVLSDLPVHREQISINADFFNPYSADELAEKMLSCFFNPPKSTSIDYSVNVKQFGMAVLDCLILD